MKKRCAEICAEVVKSFGETSWNIGNFGRAHDMYDECIRQGAIRVSPLRHRHHPINVKYHISQIISEDCKRVDGVWCCNKRITYPGIVKKPVNYYELREAENAE